MGKEGRNGLLKYPLQANYEKDIFLNTFSTRKKQLSDKLTLCSDVTEQTPFSDQGLL